MKGLCSYLAENITNAERQYRQFVGILYSYGVEDLKSIEVRVTTKNNYAIYVGEKKICLLSNNIISEDVLRQYKIKVK